MMRYFTFVFILIFHWGANGQSEGFQLKKDQVRIPFKLVHNLILIPVQVNGEHLTFLLDTGASATVLYSQTRENQDFSQVKKVQFSGTGTDGNIQSIKTVGNKVTIGNDFVDDNHTVHIISGEELNFLNHLDVPINGLIGYHFFRKYPVKIDYTNRYLIIYRDSHQLRVSKYEKLPISIEVGQPYLEAGVQMRDQEKALKLLLDLGNNDALWLFPLYIKGFVENTPNINTVLGQGAHGIIRGKRSRINALNIGPFKIARPILSTLDANSLRYLLTVSTRKGSIGNEVLKRFHIIFDYPNEVIYLRKNKNFKLPFLVNKSGIKIQHTDFVWEPSALAFLLSIKDNEDLKDSVSFEKEHFKFRYSLTPKYMISSCRKDAPCDQVGLKKGDYIVSINGKATRNLSLSQIEKYFFDKKGTYVRLSVQRGKQIINFGLTLKDPIPYVENP